MKGARAAGHLKDGSRVLITRKAAPITAECDDIGTVKIPRWLTEYTGKQLVFETSSGSTFPEDLSGYDLIVHCGGCMLNPKEMKHRIASSVKAEVPIVNYWCPDCRHEGNSRTGVFSLSDSKNPEGVSEPEEGFLR